MAQRIKGQEVLLVLTGPNGVEEGVFDVPSMDWEVDMELLRRSYLGETADRFDDIFKGITGSMTLHMENAAYAQFQQRIQDRAQRRAPASTTYNLVAAFAFPDGTRLRLNFQNIFFGAQPTSVSSREDYVESTLNWGCSKVQRIV